MPSHKLLQPSMGTQEQRVNNSISCVTKNAGLDFYQTNIQFCHIVVDTDLQTDDKKFLLIMQTCICERDFYQKP